MKALTLLFLFVSFSALADQVIGEDERVQIGVKHTDPFYATVGQLEVRYDGKTSFCTATLITRRHIITNGHCVTKSKKGGFHPVSSFTFTPGRLNLYETPKGQFKVESVHTFKKWIVSENTLWDVAVLKLDRDSGMKPQIELVEINDGLEELWSETLYITGYQGDKDFGTMWEGQGEILHRYDDNIIHHSVDTSPGSSGSIMRWRSGSKWKSFGINRGNFWNIFIGETNKAVVFTPEVMKMIRKWTSL